MSPKIKAIYYCYFSFAKVLGLHYDYWCHIRNATQKVTKIYGTRDYFWQTLDNRYLIIQEIVEEAIKCHQK